MGTDRKKLAALRRHSARRSRLSDDQSSLCAFKRKEIAPKRLFRPIRSRTGTYFFAYRQARPHSQEYQQKRNNLSLFLFLKLRLLFAFHRSLYFSSSNPCPLLFKGTFCVLSSSFSSSLYYFPRGESSVFIAPPKVFYG